MNAILAEHTTKRLRLPKHVKHQFKQLLTGFTALSLIGFTGLANALYQYTYNGNAMTGTYTQYIPEYPEPYNVVTTEFSGAIFTSFTSDTLLTGPMDMNDIDSFMMGGETEPSYYGNGSSITGNWVYPYPYPFNRYDTSGQMNISDVDANGLPTAWNIKLQGTTYFTRITDYYFESSSFADKIYGSSEYGSTWTAQLNNNPGVWKVTSVVPEPETYAMMLAGLGLIGVMTQRKKNASTSPT